MVVPPPIMTIPVHHTTTTTLPARVPVTTTVYDLERLAPIVRYLTPPSSTASVVPARNTKNRPVSRGLISDDLILRIGRCEQPGRGWAGIAWDHHGTYSGGLGLLNVNWRIAARALGLPLDAALATPAQQMAGFRYHAAHHGLNGWSCWTRWHRAWGY